MPHGGPAGVWGRPSWGANTRSERMGWERERAAAAQRAWEEEQEHLYANAGGRGGRSQATAAARFQELDTEDSDDDQHGVALAGYYKNGQVDLHGYGSGVDLRRRAELDRRRFEYSDFDQDGELIVLDEGDDLGNEAMQLALRDKEEDLVKRALERIRRAKMMGKKNVRLPPPEHEALQRKMEKDRKAAEKEKAKAKQPALATKKSVEGRRTSGKGGPSTAVVPAGKRKGSRGSLHQVEAMPVVPLEYYDQAHLSRPTSQSSNSGTRRHASDQAYHPSATTRRPLPDDPNWQPRSRSNSNLAYDPAMAYGYDPYGPFPPTTSSSQRPSSSRRNVSGPAELGYPHVSQHPPRGAPLAQSRVYGSDPALLHGHQAPSRGPVGGRFYAGGGEYEDDDDEDGSDEGVQVDVRAYGSDVGGFTTDNGVGSRNASPKKAVRSRRNTGRR